ncbi:MULTISPECIES: helix-turn-helix transcriptional regulator [Alphaproteobacteria]|uniref:Transcriptional regulator n=2 Tax=Alphaproteobacteria TaxID=28211 RepID=A0A512HCG6_9HYPH|nr:MULTISPECIES: LuxR C-terminal-related transcriptional regulator [Alphaproteobacteria]GEO83137.1 transcriptional regulator [Ciceribacter naphthalenivorans]GLR20468.1 transcriptional regulator [Ciceribacter naphthalenivorans]GLT03324.1 transcriptional regulator [Sphingomonas psychrolutea]
MTDQGGYFDLLDWLRGQKVVRPLRFFRHLQTTFNVAHVFYIDTLCTPAGIKPHRLHHTFGPSAAQRVNALGPRVFEPPLRQALAAIEPLDWNELEPGSPARAGLDRIADVLAITSCGVAYPLISYEGRQALLAVHRRVDACDWRRFRRLHDRDLQALAIEFHAALLKHNRAGRNDNETALRLTQRERQALYWSAAGKSYWEIAVILGITERTVRYFMANARRKLNVVSNTQAVAEAAWRGLISEPDTH